MITRGDNPAAALLHHARGQEQAGCLPEAVERYETAIAAAERAGDATVLAEALRRLAVLRHYRNDTDAARQLCHRSHEVARDADHSLLAAEALNTLGVLDLKSGLLH